MAAFKAPRVKENRPIMGQVLPTIDYEGPVPTSDWEALVSKGLPNTNASQRRPIHGATYSTSTVRTRYPYFIITFSEVVRNGRARSGRSASATSPRHIRLGRPDAAAAAAAVPSSFFHAFPPLSLQSAAPPSRLFVAFFSFEFVAACPFLVISLRQPRLPSA